MDHTIVARQKMAERYFLNELEPEARDEFEEHFFDCPACAQDMTAGADFLEQTKIVLAEKTAPVLVNTPTRASVHGGRSGWFSWLRPAFAAPVMALLLAVIGYQSLLMYSASRPHVVPWGDVNVATYGDGTPIQVPGKSGFLLFVRIPQGAAYERYIADLYNPEGKLEWSLPFPGIPGQDEWPVQVPAGNHEAGIYRLSVRGFTAAGEGKDIGSKSFEVQILK